MKSASDETRKWCDENYTAWCNHLYSKFAPHLDNYKQIIIFVIAPTRREEVIFSHFDIFQQKYLSNLTLIFLLETCKSLLKTEIFKNPQNPIKLLPVKTILLGFSKGCVALNTLISEVSSLSANAEGKYLFWDTKEGFNFFPNFFLSQNS